MTDYTFKPFENAERKITEDFFPSGTSITTGYNNVTGCDLNFYDFSNFIYDYTNDLFGKIGCVVNVKEKITSNFPKYDLYKENGEYYLEFAISGYDKTDIAIKVQNNMLFIAGKKKERKEEREYFTKQLAYRNWKVMFELDNAIDVDNIKAKFENGLLKIKLPVKEDKKEKIIQID